MAQEQNPDSAYAHARFMSRLEAKRAHYVKPHDPRTDLEGMNIKEAWVCQ